MTPIRTLLEEIDAIAGKNLVGPGRYYNGDAAQLLDDSDFKIAVNIAVTVAQTVIYARDGSIFSQPETDFETVVKETPYSAELTVRADGQEYTATLPVLCCMEVLHQE